jgi:hypothetical protein
MACMRTCRIILTRIRGRWGEERFRNIFKRTVEAGLTAKIATAEDVHIDASLIRCQRELQVRHVSVRRSAMVLRANWHGSVIIDAIAITRD